MPAALVSVAARRSRSGAGSGATPLRRSATRRCWSRPAAARAAQRPASSGTSTASGRLGRRRAAGELPEDRARQKAWMRMDPELEGVVGHLLRRAEGLPSTGTMYELAAATVEYGRQVGARVLEGHPTEPTLGKTVIWDEASVGLLQVFIDAGYEVEASPPCAAGWSDTDSAQRPDARFCPNRHLLEAAGGTVKAKIATESNPRIRPGSTSAPSNGSQWSGSGQRQRDRVAIRLARSRAHRRLAAL